MELEPIKWIACIIVMVLAALSSGCTSNFGAIGGAEIQKIYNERVLWQARVAGTEASDYIAKRYNAKRYTKNSIGR